MLKNLSSLLSYSKLSVVFLWRQSKKYVLLTVLKIVLDAVQVFPPMYLASWSIDLLMRKVEFGEYFQVILFTILLIITLAILGNILSSRLNYTKKSLYDRIKMDINNICLYTDYENLQSKTFMEKKNMAIESLNSGCLDMFIESLHRLVSGILIIAGVIYFGSLYCFRFMGPNRRIIIDSSSSSSMLYFRVKVDDLGIIVSLTEESFKLTSRCL